MLVTDNGPCSSLPTSSALLSTGKYTIQHRAQNTHRAMGRQIELRAPSELFFKCKTAGVTVAEALLDYRNTRTTQTLVQPN